ncbi:MAG: O-antigen ligase family protein, partial [Planctomycetales bacterium]|nr:O-antigen ligase family protein [Planctomycetales bacterium]
SPVRKQFEDRLASTEPIATFALTNSLAAYLSTWLVALFGVGLSAWSDGRTNRGAEGEERTAVDSRRPSGSTLLAGALAVLLIGGCLVLTKSRTAYLATMMGVGLLANIHADAWRRRIGWRLPLMAMLVVGAIIAGAFLVGGLDRLVLSEAPKSLLYRWEYWQATMSMIADHPWFGIGPGSFQEHYTAYKLPQSSETILEPHNFVLEIAAIAGLPALVAFAAVLFVAGWRIVRGRASSDLHSPAKLSPANSASRGSLLAVVVGASVGGLMTSPVQFLVGYVLDPVGVWLALIAAAATWIGLSGWVASGRLSNRTLGIAAAVLLVNLLVSGGIGTPGVAQSLWLLLAVLPVGVPAGDRPSVAKDIVRDREDDRAQRAIAGWPLNRAALASAALFTLVLLVAFIGQVYSPVLRRQAVESEAAMFAAMGRTSQAEAAFLEAAEIDPASAEPWEQLTAMRLQVWLREPTFEHQQAFEQAAARMLEHLPHSHRANTMYGNWLLAGYRRSSRAALVDEVLTVWERAARLYPNSAMAHARLAWAAHVAGDDERAASEAAEALRLDALNPHVEQQLANQTLDDPAASEAAENVELLMQTLRSSKDHSSD